MTIPSWIKSNFGRWTQTPDGRWVNKPKPTELEDEVPIPATQEQVQRLLTLIVDIIEQQVSLKAQIAALLNLAKAQQNTNEEVKAAFELLFGRVIELEQAIVNAEIEIPRANKVVN